MWAAYRSAFGFLDVFIIAYGVVLLGAHLLALAFRLHGQYIPFVQRLDRWQTACLSLTELLPVFGLLGTVLSLLETFMEFKTGPGGAPDIAQTIRTFAPALSTTASALMMIAVNLPLNTLLWWLSSQPTVET